MDEKLESAKKILKKYNQEHLLTFYDELPDAKKEILLEQILNTNFDLIQTLFNSTKISEQTDLSTVEPIPYVDKFKLSNEELSEYTKIGTDIIKQNKFAVLTMAGGQGTRLGHKGPKGSFTLELDSNKSIFEILCNNLKSAQKKYGVTIPWYLMTSNENNTATIKFFEDNNYFDYPKEAFTFFIQGELPMLDTDGNIILNENGLLKLASDGHGGIFEAMFKNNVLKDMQSKNIEWIFISGVDNILAKLVDPSFIGICIKNGSLAGGKSVVKSGPEEKVGVFCKKLGKPSVIEYTEISKEMCNMRDSNDELMYGESHIICNLFNIKAIENISKNSLPYHSAFKKANYMNGHKELVVAEEPNSYKFEAFIFDAFSRLDNMTIYRVKREEEFAPVKNAKGVDSPETAKNLYLNYTKKDV
ncbi:MAG: UTP--glucose-1-phosphate uridylyltransferase [Lachnospiraceae bacterium]|jgi:UDP-N-acetylglucosamine/UDP-N-acetylgalactosamine diphosphorylase|nr:UTP--glucose-1-phosphate uridylyltransferase [Lachnospiraceae bacterium]